MTDPSATELIVESATLIEHPDSAGDNDLLIFLIVRNRSRHAVTWLSQEHHIIGDDGFQYPCSDSHRGVYDLELSNWYDHVDIQPETKIRGVVWVESLPEDVEVEEVVFDWNKSSRVELDDVPSPDIPLSTGDSSS